VAVRDNPSSRTAKKTSKTRKAPLGLIFWIGFLILVAGLFLVNRELIRQTLERTQLAEKLFGENTAEEPVPPPEPAAPEPPPGVPPPEQAPVQPDKPIPPEPSPAAEPVQPATPERPSSSPPSQPPASQTPPPEAARERTLYFTQISGDGTIMRVKVSRRLPVSDSPMLDVLQVLLQGPTAEEQRRGIRSLIPPGSRVLSAAVRGNTAYISFNEEFQYTEYGVEGYVAQLRQIIWTVTEFSTVGDVQFLIEGRQIDYRGEGVWIGGPLSRESL
jgi:spore germination protein GerM